jgi:DNA-binding NtrC family response regulator
MMQLSLEVPMALRVLSVGSCGSDDARLARVVVAETGSAFQSAYDPDEALEKITKGDFSLILVNRVIDGDGSSGVDFIGRARASGVTAPLMLISDYADAQAAAVANGALPGFGKSTLFSEETGKLLKEAVGIG